MAFFDGLAGTLVQEAVDAARVLPCVLALEWLFPRSTKPGNRLKGLALLAVYFVLAAAILAAEQQLFARLAIKPLFVVHLQGGTGALGLVLAVAGTILAAAVGDFFYYWTHRLQHASPLLWRFHSVHHSIRDLNALNSWHHWTEEIARLPLMATPLALLIQIDHVTAPVVAFLITLQSVYIHSQSALHVGPLVSVFGDNRAHRIHHSVEREHWDKNFGVFTMVWDRLFGTFYLPKPGEWPETGVAGQAEADGAADYLFAPFRDQRPQGSVVVSTETSA